MAETMIMPPAASDSTSSELDSGAMVCYLSTQVRKSNGTNESI